MKDRIMKLDKNIQEYIGLGLRAGLFNKNNLERIVSRLERVNFSVDNNNPGDAQTEPIRDRNNPRISYGLNVKMNERRTLNSGRYYFKDEVLFHELTHCINGIYENFMENLSLWFDLDKMFENNFSVKSDAIESMANDPNYRQKSYSWLVLDEFVAQYVAQLLVEIKYNKKIYVNESKLIRQSNPSINVNNNFADYHEFYDIVINFIKPIYGNDLNKFIDLMILQTSTFGIRYSKYNRVTLDRKFTKIETEYGKITVKLGYYNGQLIRITPEYEDCKKISINKNIPLNSLVNNINYLINKKFNINY